ncbi:MAG: (2Fe-2S)-binding protein [Deltaproteobacteria bacterium]|nr:(2Fe-2S)-binding protein [Deltaproteobacteria bacterium]
MISLSIDGKRTTVAEGTSVLDAARGAGARIPTLCYHPSLRPYGACRLCSVEITHQGRTRVAASCALPAQNDMEVCTASERVVAGRRMIIELLLARCPEASRIKELAAELGARTDRLKRREEKCILCGQCVAVCAQVLGVGAIGFSGRGVTRRVGRPFEGEGRECIACGACTYVCPTGAIQMEHRTLERSKEEREPRYCRYMRLGMVPQAICPSAYECFRCEVDQQVEDFFGTHPAFVVRPARRHDPALVRGYLVMPDRYYHAGHAWAERLASQVRVGLDDFGRAIAGPIRDVTLLVEPGAQVAAGQSLWRFDLGKGRGAVVHAPVSGTVAAVNEDVLLDPGLVGRAPYSRGWICRLKPSSGDAELGALRYEPAAATYFEAPASAVSDWLSAEVDKLHHLLGDRAAELLAGASLPDALPGPQWQAVAEAVFGPQG